MAVDTIEKAIYAILVNDETVEPLVSTRIYPLMISKSASMPAIGYQQITGPRHSTMDGTIGVVTARFQINCWATTPLGSRILADAVRGALDQRTSGTGTVIIQSIELEDEGDLSVLGDVEQLNRYGKRQDYEIWFEE